MLDTREACACETDNAGRSVPVLNVCFVYNACQHVTLRIGHDVPFPTLDFLPGIEAARSARFCCLDALTINDSGCRLFIATAKPARDANEGFVEKIKDAAITETVEIILDGREGWKTLREQRSLTAGRRDILDGVPDFPQI